MHIQESNEQGTAFTISVKSTIEKRVADVQDMRDYSVKKVPKHVRGISV